MKMWYTAVEMEIGVVAFPKTISILPLYEKGLTESIHP